MSGADFEKALDRARAELADRFAGQTIEIVDTFDIAWSCWDGDSRGALITVDGVPRIVAIDQTVDDERFEAEIVARLQEYRRLIDDTERVLSTLCRLREHNLP